MHALTTLCTFGPHIQVSVLCLHACVCVDVCVCLCSYRRFNHFDELSGRFWLRSWAGSADSLDNPAFTRSDELLHLRALDRPCCYHDDTLSLPSTCPSHGTRINTIYPHRYTRKPAFIMSSLSVF